MKKFLALSLALVVVLLAGCQAKDFSLTDGRYIPEGAGEDGIAVPYLLVRGNTLDVIQSVAVSYQPSGPMVRNGNDWFWLRWAAFMELRRLLPDILA